MFKPQKLLMLSVVLTACAHNIPSQTVQTQALPYQVLRPVQLDPLDVQVSNPRSGLFTWFGNRFILPPLSGVGPSRDNYFRTLWKHLEVPDTSRPLLPNKKYPCKYDFSWLDSKFQALQPGERLGIRLQPMLGMNEAAYPPNIDKNLANDDWQLDDRYGVPTCGPDELGQWYENKVYVPKWGDATFQNRLTGFYKALAERYDGHAGLSFLDIGTYGFWGEWHLYGLPESYKATEPQKKILADAMLSTFRTTPLLMMVNQTDTLEYALGLTPTSRVGWRSDSLGWEEFNVAIERCRARITCKTLFDERYKFAPTVTEFSPSEESDPRHSWGTNPQTGTSAFLQRAFTEAVRYHSSLVPNGNLLRKTASETTVIKWEVLTEPERQQVKQLQATLGFKPTIDQVTLTPLDTGGFRIQSRWKNLGTTPALDSWKPLWCIRNAAGTVVHSQWININLKNLTPDRIPYINDDLPALPSGTYTLEISITDSRTLPADQERYRLKPLMLSLQGQLPDGAYNLGQFTLP
ncbi:hypothetical protein [Deinococcus roseus]|uniref:Beta-galactosidase n=1 Tax=Deinococcus roseus TaxID=392414 RepID=A0ABQ2D0H0_9DEIO|nr:hypothetical protein [Deinococcus roseus]GGJ39138.1 beta-galactosidase [Deinococcus roseus]